MAPEKADAVVPTAEPIEETISKGAEELAKADGSQEAQDDSGGSQTTENATASASAEANNSTTTNVYLQQGYYIVEQGDKLTDISRKVYGTEDMVSQICQKNNIENGDHICAGDKLLLP